MKSRTMKWISSVCSPAMTACMTLVLSVTCTQAQEIDPGNAGGAASIVANGPDDKFLYATGKEVGAPGGSNGTINCVGGQPTNLPFPWCTPETNRIVIRGAIRYFNYHELAGPAATMFDGTPRFVFNCNWDQNYQGPCWGTFEWLVTGKGGTWEGNFTGQIDLLKGVVTGAVVGHGNGGDLDGLQMKYDVLYPGGIKYGDAIFRVLTKSN